MSGKKPTNDGEDAWKRRTRGRKPGGRPKGNAVGEITEAFQKLTEDPDREVKEVERALRVRAMSLRLAGHSYAEIGEELGVTEREAKRMVEVLLTAAEKQNVDHLRELENARLDALQKPYWNPATNGDIKALGGVLKISEARRKMNGLDAPSQLVINAHVKHEMDQAFNKLEALLSVEQVINDPSEIDAQEKPAIEASPIIDAVIIEEDDLDLVPAWTPTKTDVQLDEMGMEIEDDEGDEDESDNVVDLSKIKEERDHGE